MEVKEVEWSTLITEQLSRPRSNLKTPPANVNVYFVNAVMFIDYKRTIKYHENQYKDMIEQCINRINIAYIIFQIIYIISKTYIPKVT